MSADRDIRTLTTAQFDGGRPYQEDRFIIGRLRLNTLRRFSFFRVPWPEEIEILAVCDGHGGDEVAEYIYNNLVRIFRDCFYSCNRDMKKALCETVQILHEQTKHMLAGSTLSIVIISSSGSRADVAVLGDSPVIIFDHTKSFWISPEHNARSNTDERNAAIARGAEYIDGYIGLSATGIRAQLTRALGDNELDALLDRSPEVFTVYLGPESFVLVASDGLLDPSHRSTRSQMQHIIELIRKGANADDLARDALNRETNDNVTAILWKQPKNRQP